MKLDYKRRFYASPVGKTFPDKFIWDRVRRHNPGVADNLLQDTADEAFHHFLNYVGLACLLVYAAITVYLCIPRVQTTWWW